MNITVENYTKQIEGSVVLSEINMSLESGYIYGLQGVNGSGKTMLMRALCGLIYPTSGGVQVDGRELGKEIDFPPSVGILLENPDFLSGETGLNNLRVLGQLRGLGKAEAQAALLAVGLDPTDRRKFRKYSLGMKQRLGIAAAILGEPELILLDEPFNALDADGTAQVHRLILQLKEAGKLIVLSCHIAEQLESLADVRFTLVQGKLLAMPEAKESCAAQ